MVETSMQIKNLADLSKAAKMVAGDNGHLSWFRGEPQVRSKLGPWKLTPKIHRPSKGPGGQAVYYSHASEVNMAQLFRTQMPSRYRDCPGSKEFGKWLVLMRHYGLPTRLLDWTESILVSAFFAVEDGSPEDQPGVIWGLRPFQLNKPHFGNAALLILEWDPRFETPAILTEAFRGGRNAISTLGAIGHEVDLRIMVQHSRFTIHGTEKPLDEFIATLEGPPEILMRFEIPPPSKKPFRDELFAIGIRRSTLFPEPDSLAEDIQQRIVPPTASQPGV